MPTGSLVLGESVMPRADALVMLKDVFCSRDVGFCCCPCGELRLLVPWRTRVGVQRQPLPCLFQELKILVALFLEPCQLGTAYAGHDPLCAPVVRARGQQCPVALIDAVVPRLP